MKLKISHRPEAFFDLFTESAENLRTGAELLQDLIGDYRDVELKAQRVADREHDGDEVTHAIIRRLKHEGKLLHQSTIEHSYPFEERTDTVD